MERYIPGASGQKNGRVGALAAVAIASMFVLGLARIANSQDIEFPCSLTHFKAAEGNPVFTAEGPGHWDVKIRERGWILREQDGYHLWFTGYDGTREGKKMLGYATSPDGIRWERHPRNPIYADVWIEDMMVVKDGDTYYMFAEGEKDQAQLLTSTDKIHWTRLGTIQIRRTDGQPISPGPFGTPTAWKENDVWYLIYERGDRALWLASGNDPLQLTHVQDDPIMTPGPASYESEMIAANQVVRQGDRYFLYYHGRGKEPLWSSNIATSTDRVHWVKYGNNPLQPVKENKSSGIVVFDGKANRLYTMHDRVDLHFEDCPKQPRPE
ncbi:MAG: glycosylase [Planctomycetota bacterium]